MFLFLKRRFFKLFDMRKYAFLKKPYTMNKKDMVYKIMIHKIYKQGTYVYFYCSKEATRCFADVYYYDVKDAFEDWETEIDENGWIDIGEPIFDYAHDYIPHNDLLFNLDKLHTTELGAMRIVKNLSLNTDNVILWCKEKIRNPDASMFIKGKNWYVCIDNCQITINAYSYTIITAHKIKKKNRKTLEIIQ